jgi:aryl-alcohol dehydrogenase-like predicted oxidoreductase
MRYKLLGKSGLRVSELALGTMTFGKEWGWGTDKKSSQAIHDTYANAGGNFIDTANRYTNGTSEKYVGEFINSDRDHFVVATKYTLWDRQNDPNFSGNHRKNMMRSMESSLRRLNIEYIDLLWIHAWDFMTPVDEVLRGLDDLVRAGKVHYIGVSDTPAWIISQANTMAELYGWSRFVGLQIRYNLIDRTAERDLLPMARAFDLAVTPWSVLSAGVLTGKYNKEDAENGRASLWGNISERDLAIAAEVLKVAEEIGQTPSQVALNWVRQQPGTIIPIIGARTVNQLADNMGALDFSLSEEHLKRLNIISQFDLGFPHEFLASDGVRDVVFGGTYSQIDNHH